MTTHNVTTREENSTQEHNDSWYMKLIMALTFLCGLIGAAQAISFLWLRVHIWNLVGVEAWEFSALLGVALFVSVVWLKYGRFITLVWDFFTPRREHSFAYRVRVWTVELADTVRSGVWSFAGVRARQWADVMSDGQWVIPFEDVREDRRKDTSEVPSLIRDESLMVAGQTGSGKTKTIEQLLRQQEFDEDTPIVVYEYKQKFDGDGAETYQEFFESEGYDVVRLSPLPGENVVTWNVFEEIENEQQDIPQLAAELTESVDGGEFFSDAGQQLLAAVMMVLFRRSVTARGVVPTNRDLINYLNRRTPEEIWEDLKVYDDLHSIAGYIDPSTKKQAIGVIASMQVSIEKMFTGEFGEAGSFSMREYMRDPQGTVLVLDHSARHGRVTEPVYRMLLDMAAVHSLSEKREGLFLLDEFAGLPPLLELERLLNAGRSALTQVVLGVQATAQIRSTYGHDVADSILSGCTQQILMQQQDPSSAEYVQEMIGTDVEERTVPVHDTSGNITGSDVTMVETYALKKPKIRQFEAGECVVIGSDGGWVYGQLMHPDDSRSVFERASQLVN